MGKLVFNKNPDAIKNATEKIVQKLQELKDAMNIIDRETV